ncbi:hypothetical protein FOZ62_005150, partial [Perkinsus olseni]
MSHQVYTECSSRTTVDFALKGRFIANVESKEDGDSEGEDLVLICGGCLLRLYRITPTRELRFVCETLLSGRCHDAVVYRRPRATVDSDMDDTAGEQQDQVLLIFRDGQLSLLCFDPYANAMRCTCSYSPLYGGVSHVTGVEEATGADGSSTRTVSVVAETGHCLNDPQHCTVRASATRSLCAITVSDRLGHLTLCKYREAGGTPETVQIRRLLGLYSIDDMQFLDTPSSASKDTLPVLAVIGPSFLNPRPSASRMEHSSHNASMLSILAVDMSRIVSTVRVRRKLLFMAVCCVRVVLLWAAMDREEEPLAWDVQVPLGLGTSMLLLSPDAVVAVSGGFGATWCQPTTEAASAKELTRTRLPIKQRNLLDQQLSMDGCATTVWRSDVVVAGGVGGWHTARYTVIFALASSVAYICHVIFGAGEQITDLVWQRVEVTLPLQAVHTMLSYRQKNVVICASTMGDLTSFDVEESQLTLSPASAQRLPALSARSDSESTMPESPEDSCGGVSVFEAVQKESDDPLLGRLMEMIAHLRRVGGLYGNSPVSYAGEKVSSQVVPSVKCRSLNPHLLPSLGVVRHAAPLPASEDLPSDLLVLSCGMSTTGRLAVVHREGQVPIEEIFTCSISTALELDSLRSISLWTVVDGDNRYGVLSLGQQEGCVLLDLTSSIDEVYRTTEAPLDVGKMGDSFYMVTPLGVRRLPIGCSAEMVLHFGLPCKQASLNDEFVAAVMDDGTLGLFHHIDGSFKEIPTDRLGCPDEPGASATPPPVWGLAHVSGGKMTKYLTLVEQETSAVKIYDISVTPPVLVFDVACIAVAPPLLHPRVKTTNLFLSITDPTSRPISPPPAPPPIDATSVVAAVQLHWIDDLPVLVVLIRNRPPLIYRSFSCPGRPLQESFPYSFQMVEHKNCGLVAEMSSSTEDTTVWASSALVSPFARLGSYDKEGLFIIPGPRASPLVVVKSKSEEIFVHPIGPPGTVSASALSTEYNPDGLITVQLSASGDDGDELKRVDVDLVLYRFAAFQPPAGEGEERIASDEEAAEIDGQLDGPVMAVDDHDVLMGDADGVLNGAEEGDK